MQTRELNGSAGKLTFGIVVALILYCSSLAYSQLPSGVIVESKAQKVSPVPGDFSFDVTRHTVPLGEIRGGGPPKDGIPALTAPSFVSATDARSLHSQDLVLGVHLEGVSKVYPIRILNWHELVNDQIGGRPILVTW